MPHQSLSEDAAGSRVFRVGFRPDPWAWPGWEWATDGRFSGRWDDPNGNFRTMYAGSTLRACLLEVLSPFRRDAHLAAEMDEIEEDTEDHVLYPSTAPGEVPRAWLDARVATSARLHGNFFTVADAKNLAFLYPQFIGRALKLGLDDFDTAALKDSRARALTQAVASWVFEDTDLDGVAFASRHGDDLKLWVILERSPDSEISPLLEEISDEELQHHSNDIREVFGLLGLRWQED